MNFTHHSNVTQHL